MALGYGLALFWQAENEVPASFTAARMQGAIIAQTIVNNSNQSTDELNAINKYDQEGDYADALASTTDLINQSAGIAQRGGTAFHAGEPDDDRSFEHHVAARAAGGAASITIRLAVINELISYSNDLDQLLAVLQSRFSGTPVANARWTNIVNQINADVNADQQLQRAGRAGDG